MLRFQVLINFQKVEKGILIHSVLACSVCLLNFLMLWLAYSREEINEIRCSFKVFFFLPNLVTAAN